MRPSTLALRSAQRPKLRLILRFEFLSGLSPVLVGSTDRPAISDPKVIGRGLNRLLGGCEASDVPELLAVLSLGIERRRPEGIDAPMGHAAETIAAISKRAALARAHGEFHGGDLAAVVSRRQSSFSKESSLKSGMRSRMKRLSRSVSLASICRARSRETPKWSPISWSLSGSSAVSRFSKM